MLVRILFLFFLISPAGRKDRMRSFNAEREGESSIQYENPPASRKSRGVLQISRSVMQDESGYSEEDAAPLLM